VLPSRSQRAIRCIGFGHTSVIVNFLRVMVNSVPEMGQVDAQIPFHRDGL